ncbi:MAG: hypothetical protein IH624_17865 [Phycisphaerae bacterium]|nr:hypothetical protein [Phycisphaerae bacterium]
MSNDRKKKPARPAVLKEFVTVAFAEDMDLAQEYKKLLNEGDIPAAIKTQPDAGAGFPGIAVMVPEDYLDEAHVLIESQGAYSDFYDMVFGDQDDLDDEEYEDDQL